MFSWCLPQHMHFSPITRAEEKGNGHDKLMKSTKSGKKEKNFSYEPYLSEDDEYTVTDDFDFGNWEWEFVEEQPLQTGSAESEEQPLQTGSAESDGSVFDSSLGVMSLLKPTNGVGDIMGRVDAVTEEGQYQFSNFLAEFDDPALPVTIPAGDKLGVYKFNFPTIHHTVYSGPVHLKAHSRTDLGPFDPEIFSILQSVLTPYLQEKMGPALQAYNLEVDYSPGSNKSVGKDDVVTLMEVKVTIKVVSNSIESFQYITSIQASRWMHDFFYGSEMYTLIEALQYGNIPIVDIAFANQEFESTFSIAEANSQSFGVSRGRDQNSGKPTDSVAMIGITLSVLAVGMLFFMHYTGRLPSKETIGDFSVNTRDSFSKRMSSSMKKLSFKKRRKDDGRRKRTFSGTFRRFPTGGLQKAAIQKKPAKSEQYLKDAASVESSMSALRSYKSGAMDDYTLSHYAADYGPGTPSRQSSMPPMTPVGQRSSDDEFSMPDTYESPEDGRAIESLLGRVGKTAAYMMSPGPRNEPSPVLNGSPFPSRAARRVTAADIASPNEVDNWSIKSYESEDKSQKNTPSNHPLYRGWNESGPELRRPQPPVEDGESRRQKLSLPYFS